VPGKVGLDIVELTAEYIWLRFNYPQSGTIKEPLGQPPALLIRSKSSGESEIWKDSYDLNFGFNMVHVREASSGWSFQHQLVLHQVMRTTSKKCFCCHSFLYNREG
jgi:hypothetical protein